jgi:prophage antirepressor-like protein
MDENNKIQLFEDKRIRTAWDEENEEWFFSIIDVVEVLTGTDNPRACLKTRLPCAILTKS